MVVEGGVLEWRLYGGFFVFIPVGLAYCVSLFAHWSIAIK